MDRETLSDIAQQQFTTTESFVAKATEIQIPPTV